MAALLVAMAVAAVVMSAALPVWQTAARREKEAELIFRGEQYARAIAGFQRKYGNSNPPNVDVLIKERFLRRKYLDPITGTDFELITPTTELPGRATPGGGVGAGSGTGAPRAGRAGAGSRGTATPSGGGTAGRGPGGRGSTASAGRGGRGQQAGATMGIVGVMSRSTDKAFRVYNGAEYYNEWIFIATAASGAPGAPPGSGAPGVPDVEPAGRGRGARAGGARGARGGLATPQRGRGGRAAPPPAGGRGTFGRGTQ